MAPSKRSANGGPAKRAYERSETHPQYPYTPKPGTLRKFLQLVPAKPKPSKINVPLIKTWGLPTSGNDMAIVRVMKRLGLLAPDGSPTEHYAAFMKKGTGPYALGARIKETYEKFFDAYKDPREATVEELTNFFHINSGGSEKTIEYQVQTLKALADFAKFDAVPADDVEENEAGDGVLAKSRASSHKTAAAAAIHIDLHVHLPENKSKIEYDAIFESIAQHIMGKKA